MNILVRKQSMAAISFPCRQLRSYDVCRPFILLRLRLGQCTICPIIIVYIIFDFHSVACCFALSMYARSSCPISLLAISVASSNVIQQKKPILSRAYSPVQSANAKWHLLNALAVHKGQAREYEVCAGHEIEANKWSARNARFFPHSHSVRMFIKELLTCVCVIKRMLVHRGGGKRRKIACIHCAMRWIAQKTHDC